MDQEKGISIENELHMQKDDVILEIEHDQKVCQLILRIYLNGECEFLLFGI